MRYTRLDDANRVCEVLERQLERFKTNAEASNRDCDALEDATNVIALQEATIAQQVKEIKHLRSMLELIRIQRDGAQKENQKLCDFLSDEGYNISEVLYE